MLETSKCTICGKVSVEGSPCDCPPPIDPAAWKWFGVAAHFICGHDCRFHMATQVGPYLVSTVGEYWPDSGVRKIHAGVYDPAWLADNQHLRGDSFDAAYAKRFGFHEIGLDRKYETMVFEAGEPCSSPDCGCGLPTIASSELDVEFYNDRKSANAGHLELCGKWSYTAARQSEREAALAGEVQS